MRGIFFPTPSETYGLLPHMLTFQKGKVAFKEGGLNWLNELTLVGIIAHA